MNLYKTDEIAATITKIIDESKEYCFIVTPYYYAWEHLTKSLTKAAEQKKKIVFFIREEKSYFEGGEYFDTGIKPLIEYGFDVVYVKNLHAKLYMNEREVLVTSMNAYNSSSQYNFEIGVTFANPDSFKRNFIYGELMGSRPYYSIIEGRYFREEREKKEAEKKKEEEREQAEIKRKEEREKLLLERNSSVNIERKGFCIRCGTVIPFDTTKPFCLDCYKTWASWGNYDWQERYCHVCGKEFNNISMRKPCCSQHLRNQNIPVFM